MIVLTTPVPPLIEIPIDDYYNNANAKLPSPTAVGIRANAWRRPEDVETDCAECQGTGLAEGPDGPPCLYCNGTGVWA